MLAAAVKPRQTAAPFPGALAPKPSVLAIHGSASSGRQWRSLAHQLDGVALVRSPDLLGYGRAAGQGGDRLAALKAEMAQCAGKVHLVGHSLGGAIALRLAHARPDQVASVTLYDPISAQPNTAGGQRLPGALDRIWRRHGAGPASELIARFFDFWASDGLWADLAPQQQERLLRDHTGLCRDMAEVHSGDWEIPQHRYRGPVTIFRGQLSPDITADMARRIADAHSGARLTVLPDMDHFAPLTQPDAVNAHLIPAILRNASKGANHVA